MPINREQYLRYQTLDRCFRDKNKRYFKEDLLRACIDTLSYHHCGDYVSLSTRTIDEDIKNMQKEPLHAPIEKKFSNRFVYFRYSDPNYSINNLTLNQQELDQLNETLSMLSRFQGMPNFDWINDIITRLRVKMDLNCNSDTIISFDYNQKLTGIERMADLFNYIVQGKVLNIEYRSFRSNAGKLFVIHPYYLKEYNSRWFLLGYDQKRKAISNLALDRILSIKVNNNVLYKENTMIDFDSYFKDIIGVTIPNDRTIEKVILKFTPERFPYVVTKPLHPTQTTINEEECTVELSVIPNKELQAAILHYGADVEVLEPESLRQSFQEIAERMYEHYKG